MATFTNYLGLKEPASTDPFLLSDFNGNWDILDASPGVFICTSSSRPTWTSGQAGRLIYMTDYRQLSYWNGSSWQDLRDSAPVFAQGSYINTSMAHNTSPTFTVLTFTTPRASAVALWATVTYQCVNNKSQDLYQKILFDGSPLELGSFREQIRFTAGSADSGATAGLNATSMAIQASAGAGTHTVGIQVDVSNNYTTSVTMVGIKILAMISLYSSGNTL